MQGDFKLTLSVLLYLARGQPTLAHPMVERLLQKQPNNVVALLVQVSYCFCDGDCPAEAAQARLQFARRAHEAALQTYQRILTHHPHMSPDPRIGLGLCAWVLGHRERALAAWNRALHRVSLTSPLVIPLSPVGPKIMGCHPSPWARVPQHGPRTFCLARGKDPPRDRRSRLRSKSVQAEQPVSCCCPGSRNGLRSRSTIDTGVKVGREGDPVFGYETAYDISLCRTREIGLHGGRRDRCWTFYRRCEERRGGVEHHGRAHSGSNSHQEW